MITQRKIKEALDYYPDTHTFIWRQRPICNFKTLRACRTFNKVYAGMVAGSATMGRYRQISINGKKYGNTTLAKIYLEGDS